MCRDVKKGTLHRKNKKMSFVCFRGHSTGHFDTNIMVLAQFLTELLPFLSFETCIMKN